MNNTFPTTSNTRSLAATMRLSFAALVAGKVPAFDTLPSQMR